MCSAILSDQGCAVAFVIDLPSLLVYCPCFISGSCLWRNYPNADDRLSQRESTVWTRTLKYKDPCQAEDTLGKCFGPWIVTMLIAAQKDAGIEVHQRLGYYLQGRSAIASRMTRGQRAMNMLYVLRDFSPMGITLAMLALPLAIFSAPQDGFADAVNGHATSLFWLTRLAIMVWIAQKLNTWVLYRHIGLVRVANFQSQAVWTAPCMLLSVFNPLSSFGLAWLCL